MKPRLIATLVLAGAGASAIAQSMQFPTGEAAIRYRQGAYSVMAAHFSRIAMMAQGIQPFDAKIAAENAKLVEELSKLPFAAFGPGSDKGAPHRARDEVWKEPAKFKAATERMQADVSKLEQAAHSGDFEAIKTAVGAVGKACKACHDDFRGPKRDL